MKHNPSFSITRVSCQNLGSYSCYFRTIQHVLVRYGSTVRAACSGKVKIRNGTMHMNTTMFGTQADSFDGQSHRLAIDQQLLLVRDQMCNAILIALSLLGIPAVLASLGRSNDFGVSPIMVGQVLALILLCSVTFLRLRISFVMRITTLLGIVYALGLVGLINFGQLGGGKLFLLVFIMLTAMFMGLRVAAVAVAFVVLTIWFVGWGFVSGTLSLSAVPDDYHQSASTWTTVGFTMILLGGLVSAGIAKMLDFQRRLLISLQEEFAYNKVLVDQSAASLLVLNNELKLQDWNDRSSQIFMSEVPIEKGTDLRDVFGDGKNFQRFYDGLSAALLGNVVDNLEVQVSREAGLFDYIWNVAPHSNVEGDTIGLICFGQDVTELKQAQRQITQSARFTAMGEMTTSIAHEINQPLAIIRLALTNILRKIRRSIDDGGTVEPSDISSRLERIDLQVSKASRITEHMILFGSDNQSPIEPIHIAGFLENVLALKLEGYRRAGVELTCAGFVDDVVISGRRNELEQVMLSVLSNAELAMQETQSSRLKTLLIEVLETDKQVQISVTDSGHGLEKEALQRAFDPFFTTREPGAGTGLGLSVAKKLIDDMGANIEIENTSDSGAKVTITFSEPSA